MTVPATFHSQPVLSIMPHRVDQRLQTFDRRAFRFEAPSSGFDVRALDAQPHGTHELEFLCMSRVEVDEVEQFFLDRRGSYEAFWFPTWQYEFALTQVSAVALAFVENGYLDRLFPVDRWRYMAVIGANGVGGWDMRAFQVTTATNAGMSNIGSIAAGGAGWASQAPENVLLCRLAFGRLADDRLVTRWHTLEVATITVPLLEVER